MNDGSTADGDAAGEINSSERYLTIDEQEQNISFLGNSAVCVNRKKDVH